MQKLTDSATISTRLVGDIIEAAYSTDDYGDSVPDDDIYTYGRMKLAHFPILPMVSLFQEKFNGEPTMIIVGTSMLYIASRENYHAISKCRIDHVNKVIKRRRIKRPFNGDLRNADYYQREWNCRPIYMFPREGKTDFTESTIRELCLNILLAEPTTDTIRALQRCVRRNMTLYFEPAIADDITLFPALFPAVPPVICSGLFLTSAASHIPPGGQLQLAEVRPNVLAWMSSLKSARDPISMPPLDAVDADNLAALMAELGMLFQQGD